MCDVAFFARRPSLGAHLILPAKFTSAEFGMLIPETDDKRLLFFLPWEGRVIAGTPPSARREL